MLQEKAVDTLLYYMHERERIRLAKEAGKPRPWTQDKILQSYKFTNVLRENDFTTQWLIKNWYLPHAESPFEEILLNCGIARYFGTWEFCEALGWSTNFYPDRIIAAAKDRMDKKKVVFTSAYVITNGGISDKKYNVVTRYYLAPFVKLLPRLVLIAEQSGSWRAMSDVLSDVTGWGGTGFMRKEVLSDFILATRHRIVWKDLHDWTPLGPGALKGLNRMYGRVPDDQKIPKNQAQSEIKELRDKIAPRLEPWMPQFGKELDLHALQFALCEIRKYMKAQGGERLKNNYLPRSLSK